MSWYTKFQQKFAQIQKISLQEAKDRGMFGPVYHGTNSEARAKIDEEGFKVFEGEAMSGEIQHGYENIPMVTTQANLHLQYTTLDMESTSLQTRQ